ncbi:hypothetical protein RR46_00866 [Papilio xuthus]|uniref:Uncharacterized protein n=1 Tax=Papilio xuthus TaxID=66420 RepID=A0A0N1PER1_PAPXU|nr:hypothetical protein RR46_00866 [Papilio xuthus]
MLRQSVKSRVEVEQRKRVKYRGPGAEDGGQGPRTGRGGGGGAASRARPLPRHVPTRQLPNTGGPTRPPRRAAGHLAPGAGHLAPGAGHLAPGAGHPAPGGGRPGPPARTRPVNTRCHTPEAAADLIIHLDSPGYSAVRTALGPPAPCPYTSIQLMWYRQNVYAYELESGMLRSAWSFSQLLTLHQDRLQLLQQVTSEPAGPADPVGPVDPAGPAGLSARLLSQLFIDTLTRSTDRFGRFEGSSLPRDELFTQIQNKNGTAALRHRVGQDTYLANFHVDAAVVLSDVEVEVLVVDAQVPALRQVALEPAADRRTTH